MPGVDSQTMETWTRLEEVEVEEVVGFRLDFGDGTELLCF